MTAAHVLADAELAALSGRPAAQHAAVLLAVDHLPAVPAPQRVALLDEARGWLADRGWATAARPGVDDTLVREVVHRRYDGGWAAFVVANVDHLEAATAA